jgi:hypothetical protein
MKDSSLDKSHNPREAEGENMFNNSIKNALFQKQFPFLRLADSTYAKVGRLDENLLAMSYDNFKGKDTERLHDIRFICKDAKPRSPFILGATTVSESKPGEELRFTWGETIANYIYREGIADDLEYVVVYYTFTQKDELVEDTCTVYKLPKNTTVREYLDKIERTIQSTLDEQLDF